MVPDSYHDFFVASASAAGALIGLLFVALSIWQDRDEEAEHVEAHSLRATAAFTVFSNALVVSLFALVPGDDLGTAATIVALLGLGFVTASAVRLARLRRTAVTVRRRDFVFIVGVTALFAWQLEMALRLWIHPGRHDIVGGLCTAVVISFSYGIGRAWELIGGPQVGVVSEVGRLLQEPGTPCAAPADTPPAGAPPADDAQAT